MLQEQEHFGICAMKFSQLEFKFRLRQSKPLKKVKYIPMLVLFFSHRGKKVSQNIVKRSNMLEVRPVGRIVLTPVRLIRQISPREKADRIRNPLLWERLSSRDKCLVLLSDELRRGGNHPTCSSLLNPQSPPAMRARRGGRAHSAIRNHLPRTIQVSGKQ